MYGFSVKRSEVINMVFSRMQHCVDGTEVPDISKDHNFFIFRVMQ